MSSKKASQVAGAPQLQKRGVYLSCTDVVQVLAVCSTADDLAHLQAFGRGLVKLSTFEPDAKTFMSGIRPAAENSLTAWPYQL